MAADRDDEDTPTPTSKSSKGPKKRFQERDDTSDEDEDRPRKKRREEDENEPRSKRKADAEEADDEDRPRKRRRVVEDDGPRVKTSGDNIPILMLLAFIGSAAALLVICAACGWWSFDWLVLGGSGGGWGGSELEFTSVTRTQARPMDPPYLSWSGVTKQNPNTNDGKYYMVLKCGTQTVTRDFNPGTKGAKWNGAGPENGLRGSSGKLEVWVEKRPNPVANGKVVSNVYVVP